MSRKFNLAKQLKEARISLGESQAEFGKRFDTGANTISRYETGQYNIPNHIVEWLFGAHLSKHWKICENCNGRGVLHA